MPSRFAIFLRHGDFEQPAGVPSALLPHPLTAKGEVQARDAAPTLLEQLSSLVPHAELDPVIDSSDLLRAWQTACLLAESLRKRLGREFRVESFHALAERSLGSAANLSISAIESVLAKDPRVGGPPADWKSSRDYRLPLPGAESLRQAGQRVARHLVERTAASVFSAKIFVGHGASFRHAACELGVLAEDAIGRVSMHHAAPLVFHVDGQASWRLIRGAWKSRSAEEAEFA